MSHSKVRTLRPDRTGARYLNALGPVGGLTYSYTVPGGCEAMTCTIGVDARSRTDALDPGRLVEVVRGGSVVWDGTLAEPAPGGGWQVTANGSGTFGSRYAADYGIGNSWAALAPDTVIANAIGRGLSWLPTSVHGTAGLYFGSVPDSGSIFIDAMLNQMTSPGGLTWWVRRTPAGQKLEIFPVDDDTPNRLLLTAEAAPRTLGGDVNAIQVRYCKTPDLGAGYPALFATVWALDQASIDKHGRTEDYVDLSSNGAMTQVDAQAVGLSALKRYKRASYAGPFTVRAGNLRTLNGQPQDLGCFFAGGEGPMVCKLMLMDQGFGGEVKAGSPHFMVGRYEYDDDTDTADITPFATPDEDFAGLLSARAARAKGRKYDVFRHRGHLQWSFEGRGRHTRWQRRPPHARPPHVRG